MDELQALYEKLRPITPKANPADLDAYVAKVTGGRVPSFAALQQAVTAGIGGGIKAQAADAIPSAPASAPGTMSPQQAALVGGSQGLTLRFADEIEGAVKALSPTKTYQQGRDEARARFERAKRDQPGVTLASELAGGFATPGLGALGAASKGMGVVRSGATVGAAAGGLNMIGGSTSDSPQTMALEGVAGAVGGGVLGAAISKAMDSLIRIGVRIYTGEGKITEQAKDAITAILQRNGVTRQQALAALAEAEAHAPGKAILADVIPGGGRELRGAADLSPQVALSADELLAGRQAGQSARVAGSIEDNMGITAAGARETRKATRAAVRPLANRVFDPLDGQMVVSPEVNRILGHPDVTPSIPKTPRVPAGAKLPQDVLQPSKSLGEIALANPDGFTLDPRTGQLVSPPQGVSVAIVSDRAGTPPEGIQAAVQRLMDEHGLALANDPSLHLGGYRSPSGTYHVEIAKVVPDVPTGVELGKTLGQESVWDFGTQSLVMTGGNPATAADAAPVFFGTVQQTIRNLNDATTMAFRSGAGGAAEATAAQAKALTGALEGALPGFRAANRQYRVAATIGGAGKTKSAFQLGMQALNQGNSAADVTEQVGQLVAVGGREALDAWRMGLLERMTQLLRRRVTSADVAKQFANMGPDTQEIMRIAFPTPESFLRFERAMQVEKGFTRTNVAMGGPNTAARGADMVGAVTRAAERGALPGSISGVLGSVGRAVLGANAQAAARNQATVVGNALLSNPAAAQTLLSGFNPAIRGLLAPFLGAGASGASTSLLGR